MLGFILIISITGFTLLASYLFHKRKSASATLLLNANFHIDATDSIVQEYVEKMEKQHKGNSRVLEGSGKEHCSETIKMGSDLIAKKQISVLDLIGDRFS